MQKAPDIMSKLLLLSFHITLSLCSVKGASNRHGYPQSFYLDESIIAIIRLLFKKIFYFYQSLKTHSIY